MATDWARYMHQYQDVYKMYSDGGKWTWDKGRQQNAYMRQDGTPLHAETAAQYAQAHYNNFGKSEGRKVHEKGDVDYAAKLRAGSGGSSGGSSGGGSGGSSGGSQSSQMNAQLAELVKSLAQLNTGVEEKNITPEQAAENAQKTNTILTNYLASNDKKKKSFLQPLGN